MESKLTRQEKIRLLNALKVGKMRIDALNPNKVYFFTQSNLKAGIFILGGKARNQQEYDVFCMNVRSRNDNSIIWNEFKTYDISHYLV